MRVLLIHGLGRTPVSLALLAYRLRAGGHRPVSFAYFAWFQRFDDIVRRLRRRVAALAEDGPFAVVTHSLGAVLLRAALSGEPAPGPSHVVMLGPPNQPPRLARWANRSRAWSLLTRESGAKLSDDEFYRDLSPIPGPYTIVAGTRGLPFGPFAGVPNDGVVAVSETRIAPDDEVILVPGGHTFMMNRADVARHVLAALRTHCVPEEGI